MENRRYIPIILLALTITVGCEKSELEDPSPEERNPEAQFSPQEMRVNDDSDDEGQYSSPSTKDLDAGHGTIISNSSTSISNGGGNDDHEDDSDDLINDDSDNEDEGAKPRSPLGNPSGGSSQR